MMTVALMVMAAICMQAQGINFNEGKNFAQILAMAKEQGKMVFVDCYTSWCGPCKQMANQEFVKKEAGDYFNAKFVCTKVDMEKGEGPELAKKYDVSAYPTFLILHADGTLKGRSVGAADIEKFIARIEEVLKEEKGLTWYQQQFQGGNRDAAFLQEYTQVLRKNYMRDEMKKVTMAMLEGKSAADIAADKTLYAAFQEGRFTPNDDIFLTVYRQRATVAEKQGKEAAEELDELWSTYAMTCAKFDGKTYQGFDDEKFQAYKAKMAEYGVPDIQDVEDRTMLKCAQYAEDYPTLCKYVDMDTKKGCTLLDSHQMLYLLEDLKDKCGDNKKMMNTVKQAVKARINVMKKKDTSADRTFKIGDRTVTQTQYLIEQYEKLLNK